VKVSLHNDVPNNTTSLSPILDSHYSLALILVRSKVPNIPRRFLHDLQQSPRAIQHPVLTLQLIQARTTMQLSRVLALWLRKLLALSTTPVFQVLPPQQLVAPETLWYPVLIPQIQVSLRRERRVSLMVANKAR
jgi:hypothetical protein